MDSAHKARLEVEQDAKMLSNRIRLLQLEENKTQKKISEALSKLKQKEKWQKEREDRQNFRQAYKDLCSKKMKETLTRNKILRERLKNNNVSGLNSLLENNRTKALTMKEIKDQNFHKLERRKKLSLEKNYQTANRVKDGLKLGSKKIARFILNRSQESHNEYMKRVEKEDEIRNKREQEIIEMEKLELELIKRLEQSQLLFNQIKSK